MECPRETRERAEELLVCSRGVLAKESTGRPRPEPECEVRTCFQRDIDRIIHCKSFRRLKHKTQVFSSRRETTTAPGSRIRWRSRGSRGRYPAPCA